VRFERGQHGNDDIRRVRQENGGLSKFLSGEREHLFCDGVRKSVGDCIGACRVMRLERDVLSMAPHLLIESLMNALLNGFIPKFDKIGRACDSEVNEN
jgi:hypothetical protein